jgi:hypothetical protein
MSTDKQKEVDLVMLFCIWILIDYPEQGNNDNNHQQDQDKIPQIGMCSKQTGIHDFEFAVKLLHTAQSSER